MRPLVSILYARLYVRLCGPVVVALGLAMTAASGLAANSFVSPFASHKANYSIELWRLGSGTTVQNIGGVAESVLWRDCHGWLSEENFSIHITSIYGDVSDITSRHETWEARTGDSFFFSIEEDSVLVGQNTYKGTATMEEGSGEASITGSDEAQIPLHQDTLFNIQFMQAVLRAAKNGERAFRAPLFIGGGIDDSLYFVSTLIGETRATADIDFAAEMLASDKNGEDANKNNVADNMDGLWQARYWPMRLAYFNPQLRDSVPEYEVEFKLQENGIIHSYIVDYGDFSLRARLSAIEEVADETC